MLLPAINTFWHGPTLGPLDIACLRSFSRNGHRVVLHAYEPPANTPQCVELQDAEAVLPRGDIDHLLRARRFATVADLFRYEMLAQSLGVWVDCDCYCLKPIQDEDHIFGWEDESWINGAVLKLPADSAVLKNLRSMREGFIPPWLPIRRRLGMRLRKLCGRPKRLADMRWGTTGPQALTHFVKEAALTGLARPVPHYYPVHWSETARFLDPSLSMEDLVSPDTVIVHFYNEMLKRNKSPTQNSMSHCNALRCVW